MTIITISRGSLSGGELLAQQLAVKLNFKVISREVIVEAARKYGVSESKLLEETEKPPGIWARLTNQRQRYVQAMRATLGELIEGDDVIYHGHAGRFLLQGLSRVINLRLIAPLDYRIRSATIEHSFSREEALKYIEEMDEKRTRWVKRMYEADWADPTLYDLVINLQHLSIETATEIVAAMVQKKEYARTPASDQELKDFSLEHRIIAELTFRAPFEGEDLRLKVRAGEVELCGNTPTLAKREGIISVIQGIRGVKRVVLEADGAQPPKPVNRRKEETAAEVMLPIEQYPQVPQWLSIRDAISALTASSIQLKDGHQILPRYVLITNEQEKLAGIVNRRDLLKGLSIQLRTMERAQKDLQSVLSTAEMSYTMSYQWVSFFNKLAIESSRASVRTIMSPIVGTVKLDHDLSYVVTTMIQNGIDLVPVMDQGRAVGVILMTEVFDRVSQFILEGGSPIDR